VVRGGDRLGVGSRRTVVEVYATEKLNCFIIFLKQTFQKVKFFLFFCA
jgi:hypothetical protein